MSDGPWVADIAARASTLWERVALGARPRPGSKELQDERWERWTAAVGAGKSARLARRLAWEGLRPQDVRPLLGPVALSRAPAWSPARLLRRLREARAIGVIGDHPALRPATPLPFEAAWLPLTAVESRRLRRLLPEACAERLSPDAWVALERDLLRSLCYAGVGALSRELRVRRESTGTSLTRLLSPFDADADAAPAFARDLVAGEVEDLMLHHPGLARLVCALARQWHRQALRLLARVTTGADVVAARLGVDLRQIEGLTAGLSDRHNGGATVVRLIDAAGRSVIYKPRDMRLEAAFASLLEELGSEPAVPRAPAIVACDDHGWMEDVRPSALADAAAASRYHRRAGGLLALMHVLHGNDAHLENVVAAGEHPVLVDGETLLGPVRVAAATTVGPATAASWDHLEASVLRTGLLPRWVPRGDGGYDNAGLGPGWVQRDGVTAVRWRGAGAGLLALDIDRSDLPPGANVPRLKGSAVGAETHVDDVIAGFHSVVSCLARRDADALLARFAGCRARWLQRATATYGAALLASVNADALSDGAARSVVLDALHVEATAGHDPPPAWPLARRERQALECLDVPRVMVPVDHVPAGRDALWSASGLATARARLHARGAGAQARLIEAGFYARVAAADDEDQTRWRTSVRPRPASELAEPADAPALDQATAYAEAERIGALLLRDAVHGHDGSLTWVAPTVMHGTQGFMVRPIASRLYDGAVGVALFYASLARVTGSGADAAAAHDVLREIVLDPVAAVAGLPSGAVTGAGSVVWALVCLADLLARPELLHTARVAAAALTPERLTQDRVFDVSGGAAGALLAFLRLHRATGEDRWLARAHDCGDLLLASRTGDPAAWPSPDGPALTGLSHGAAGIAHALLLLTASSGDARYADAAHEAIEYERLHFVPALGNWEDLRPGGPPRGPKVMHGWCNGAPGIGLARLPWYGGAEQAAADIEIALATTRAHAFGAQDHLCCGTLGRLELLLRAGEVLHRPVLIDEARAVAGRVVARARSRGGYVISAPELPSVLVPGLFRGLSGVGLQLLRLAWPGRVPSPLLLE